MGLLSRFKDTPEKQIQRAISWVATEHRYVLLMKRQLDKLKRILNETKKEEGTVNNKMSLAILCGNVKQIENELEKMYRYAANSERKADRLEKSVEKVLKDMGNKVKITGTLNEINDLRERIHLEAANLIKNVSRFQGGIAQQIKNLKRIIEEWIEHHERALNWEPDWEQNREYDESMADIGSVGSRNVRGAIKALTWQVDKALSWQKALIVDYRKAQNIYKRYSELVSFIGPHGYGYPNTVRRKEEQ